MTVDKSALMTADKSAKIPADKGLMRLRRINTPEAHKFHALGVIMDIPIDTPPLCGWVFHSRINHS
jgi:hypothetical protein